MNDIRKKIALLAPYALHGGAEVQFLNLVNVISDQKGVDLSIFVLASDKQQKNFIKRSYPSKAKISFLDCDPKKNRVSLVVANFKLINNARVEKYDVVYFYSLYFLIFCVFARPFLGKLIYSERILSEKTKSRILIYRMLSKCVSKVIVNSETLKEYFDSFAKNVVLVRNQVRAISMPVNSHHLAKDERIKVAAISRLVDEKNIHFLILALDRQERKFVLNLYYGASDPFYEQHLKELSCDVGYEINFRGHSDLQQIYEENDLVIHPSISEGCPNTIIEAMASGYPCFCSDIEENVETGIREECIFSISDSGEDLNRCIDNWMSMENSGRKLIIEDNFIAGNRYSPEVFKDKIIEEILGED